MTDWILLGIGIAQIGMVALVIRAVMQNRVAVMGLQRQLETKPDLKRIDTHPFGPFDHSY